MNKDIVKYGLIGVAVYFALPYLKQWLGGLVPTQPAQPTQPTQTGQATQPPVQVPPVYWPPEPADQTPPAQQPPATQPPATTPDAANAAILAATDDETVKRGAATGASLWVGESDRRGIRLDHHEWNWYRALATGETQQDAELWAPGATTVKVLASEYFQARAAAGLGMAGLGAGGRIPPALMWIT